MATEKQTTEQLNEIFSKMEDINLREQEAEEALNDLRISNARKLADLQINLLNKKAVEEENLNQQIREKLLEDGFSTQAILIADQLDKALKEIEEEYAAKIKAADKATKKILENEKKAKKKAKEKEIKDETKANEKVIQEAEKARAAAAKAREKDDKAKKRDAFSAIEGFNPIGIGNTKIAREKLAEKGVTDQTEQNKMLLSAALNSAGKKLASFAKQLEGTVAEVAEAQTEIDTRLYGSKGKTSGYWKDMSENISKNIGISPFIKQADAVNNLKTLVGRGIAYNVEQRAFLETISDKIATTFEATDATLLKLVRIQQADTTAARLGMESALNAFLNNMYETTEYMTEAADAIRGSIYEASALMTAEEATDFEYQVQKWMGSLYSVGFNNTQGLADALGKLAAGDISGITDGGYGNLLVMAANKANLSTAEILANGLNDSETNALMQAMVEYLGGIYDETKNNKVVAQQFANVYGLTASDLKAAANLASSTNTIYKNNLNYGGMIQQLNSMANSMGSRTQIGTMIQNVIDNFKYGISTEIGMNPVLYPLLTVANILDETVGGIDIPSISALAMGSGPIIDLRTSVADIMRVASVSGGILGGLADMIGGLGSSFSGSGMLKAFGVNLNESTAAKITRGTGSGLLTTNSGTDVSLAGFVGNADSEVIKNKAITDAKDDANKQAIEALEEAQEIGMSNIDEHIVQIYTLLDEVVSGSRVLHVMTTNSGDSSPWTNNTGYSPSGIPRL